MSKPRKDSSVAVPPAPAGAHTPVRNIDVSTAHLASSGVARDINRDIVLELIRFRQPVSRVDLSRISGLQPSTISAIVEELIEENWIREGRVVQGSRGRPPTMLSVNENLMTLSLDLRPDRAIIALVDLSGRFLAQEVVLTVSDPAASTARIVERMQALRDLYSDHQIEGVGVSIPGRVDPATQKILIAPNLKWHGFDLRGELQKALGLQVEMDNDANACMLSELWFGRLPGVQNAVLIAVAEGLGTAILANGQLLSGHHGLAGEFGHISIDASGPLCGCGQRGCWEMFASSRAALRTYREIAPDSQATGILDLLRLAEDGDDAAHEAVTRQMRALGRGLRLITATLSPEVILITGEVTSCWAKYGPVVEEELVASMLTQPAPRLAAAGDGYRARLSGGAAMLMQRHSRYHRSTDPSRRRKPSTSSVMHKQQPAQHPS